MLAKKKYGIQTTEATWAGKISEENFMTQIAQLAKILGWTAAHFRPTWSSKGWRTACQFDAAGFPDLILVRPPRIVIAELKVCRNRPTAEQEVWLETFRCCPMVETFVWRPKDFEEIQKVLR